MAKLLRWRNTWPVEISKASNLGDILLCRGDDWLLDLFPRSSLFRKNPEIESYSLSVEAGSKAVVGTGVKVGRIVDDGTWTPYTSAWAYFSAMVNIQKNSLIIFFRKRKERDIDEDRTSWWSWQSNDRGYTSRGSFRRTDTHKTWGALLLFDVNQSQNSAVASDY